MLSQLGLFSQFQNRHIHIHNSNDLGFVSRANAKESILLNAFSIPVTHRLDLVIDVKLSPIFVDFDSHLVYLKGLNYDSINLKFLHHWVSPRSSSVSSLIETMVMAAVSRHTPAQAVLGSALWHRGLERSKHLPLGQEHHFKNDPRWKLAIYVTPFILVGN